MKWECSSECKILSDSDVWTLTSSLLVELGFFLNEQRSRDAAAPKRANTSGIRKSNNYYEDI